MKRSKSFVNAFFVELGYCVVSQPEKHMQRLRKAIETESMAELRRWSIRELKVGTTLTRDDKCDALPEDVNDEDSGVHYSIDEWTW
jgi:hypothetical protein